MICNQGISHNEWDVNVRGRIQDIHEGIGTFGLPLEIMISSQLLVENEKVVKTKKESESASIK